MTISRSKSDDSGVQRGSKQGPNRGPEGPKEGPKRPQEGPKVTISEGPEGPKVASGRSKSAISDQKSTFLMKIIPLKSPLF